MTNPRRRLPAGSFHERASALEALSRPVGKSPKRTQTYEIASGRQALLLDELPDPPADEVTDQGDTHADHEHVEA